MSAGTLWALCSSSAPSLSSPKPKRLQRSLRPRRTFQSFSRERAPPAPVFSSVSVPCFHSDGRRSHACLAMFPDMPVKYYFSGNHRYSLVFSRCVYNAPMLTALAISNYRSLRKLVVPLQRLNVITGANGSGKSSFYRALRLLGDTAQGRVVTSLAREGGLQSTLWAGPESISRAVKRGDYPVQGTRRKHPVNLRLGFAGDEFGYLIDMGLPSPGNSAFNLDPEIKQEYIWHGPALRPSTTLVDRHGPIVRIRSENNGWNIVADSIAAFDSMMTQVADPRNAPELLLLRESIRAWRFYDHFRRSE